MKYEPSTRIYQIQTTEQTILENYHIEVSLSDTFALENIYAFTVTVGGPSLDQYNMNEEEESSDNAKSNA